MDKPILELRVYASGDNFQLADALNELAVIMTQQKAVEDGVWQWENANCIAKFRKKPTPPAAPAVPAPPVPDEPAGQG